ncbi:MAG: extracellular solute-binding protein [Candidatus Aenigmatarchaeota archaeon]
MKAKIKQIISIIAIVAVIALLISVITLFPQAKKQKKVVVYVAHDQDLSEPILKEFEKVTGIKVEALYDTEATKTVGLVNRLLAEKNNPQADVFWNNEMIRTILLKDNGILQPYCSPNAVDIELSYKDKDCYWTGFGARARVILYNKNYVSKEDEPKSIFDLAKPAWKGKTCMGNPLLGSTSTHMAALFASLGEEGAKSLLIKLKENGIQVLESNSMVRDKVVIGDCWVGLTDTDDAYDAIKEGKPVEMIFPDQGPNDMGNLVFPNTIMLINGAKNIDEAKKLIDFILTSKVEEELARTALQMPLKASSQIPPNVPDARKIKPINVTFEEIYKNIENSRKFIQEVFLK